MNVGFLSQWRWTCLVHLLVRSVLHPDYHHLHLFHQLASDGVSNHFQRMNWNVRGRMIFHQILYNVFIIIIISKIFLSQISEGPKYNRVKCWIKFEFETSKETSIVSLVKSILSIALLCLYPKENEVMPPVLIFQNYLWFLFAPYSEVSYSFLLLERCLK